MSVAVPVVIIFTALTIVGVTAYASYLAEKKRTEELKQVANELGFDFFPLGDAALQSELSGFQLFSQGHSKKLANLMRGRSQDLEVAIFDYRYVTGHGKHKHSRSQTVLRFRFTDRPLPSFALRPEGMGDKIGAFLGYQDIDFESHAVFSKRYLLRGADENAIRQLFTKAVLDFYEEQRGLSTEAAGNTLLFYVHNKRVTPALIRSFMEQGFQAYSLLHAA